MQKHALTLYLVLFPIIFTMIPSGIGEMILHFPTKVDFRLKPTAGGKRQTRKLVTVVVDGLNVDCVAKMPFLSSLQPKGASYILRTAMPSYSRVGYSALMTGSLPGVSGVGSNNVKTNIADSVFDRAHATGMKTAFVGLIWWLEHWGDAIDVAAVEGGYKKHETPPKLATQPVPKGYVRFIQEDGVFKPLEEKALSYAARNHMIEQWGDETKTPADERRMRGIEAIRLLRQYQPDFMAIHLDEPDHAGHESASPYSAEYVAACQNVDNDIRDIAGELNMARDTLVVTSDHGFTESVPYAGHGGHEQETIQVPLVMIGAGVKPGVTGFGQQIDLPSTLAILLGVPFPTLNQGIPLADGLAVPRSELEKRLQQLYEAQAKFYHKYSRFLGLPVREQEGDTSYKRWMDARSQFAGRWQMEQMAQHAKRGGLGFFFLLPFFLLLYGLRTGKAEIATGLGIWLIYEVAYHTLFMAVFKIYSLSTFYDPVMNPVWMILFNVFTFSATVALFWWRKKGDLEWLGRVAIYALVPLLVKSWFMYMRIGFADLQIMPHALVLFASISIHTQTATVAFLVLALRAVNILRPKP